MKKFFSINFVLLTLALSIFGQTSRTDLEQLRKQINLPSSVSISNNEIPLPVSKPIKLYLAIKHDKRAAKDFVKWAEKWNRTDAKQFGEIQIVDNIADANMAAVQFQFGAARPVREESVLLKTGKQQSRNDANDRTVLRGIGNSNARIESSVRALKLPLYSYLIVRGQNSSWAVSYSRVDERISDENFPDRLLHSALEEKLKDR